MNQQLQTPAVAEMMARLFDLSPTGMAYAEAVRDAAGQIADFRLVLMNPAGMAISGMTEAHLGRLLSKIDPRLPGSALFDRYVAVVEQGEPFQQEHTFGDRYLSLTVQKHDDGFLATYLDITELKVTQQQLQRQADTFNGVLAGMLGGMLILEAIRDEAGQLIDLRYEYLSDQNLRDTGYRREQMIGNTIGTLFPGVKQSQIWAAYERVLATGEPACFEEYYQADGYDNTVNCQVYRLDENRLVSTYEVINDLVAARQEATEQAELLRSILDGSQNGIIAFEAVRDPATGRITDFRYILQNEANRRRVGRTDEQVLGHTMLEFFADVQDNGLFDAYVRVVETGEPFRRELAYNYGGGPGWYDISVVKRAGGIVMTVMDKTAQKHAELTIQQQAQLLQDILDSVPTSIFVSEAIRETPDAPITDFLLREINLSGQQGFGLSRKQAIGQRASVLFPQDRTNGIFDSYATVVETGQALQFEWPYEWEGKTSWVDIRIVPFGQQSVVASALDITPLKQLQLQLEQQNRDLRRSNENLQQFAYIASHDLQEPLRKIQAFGDMLADGYRQAIDDNGLDFIRRMQSAASRMSLLISDLLSYSRLATQQAPYGSVALGTLLTEVLDDLQVAVQQAGASVELIDLPAVQGDKAQLRQLFQNLLANALKFRQEGVVPQVRVACRRVRSLPEGAISKTNDRQPYYEISVADNGIGFDEKYLDRIFGVFQRLHGKSEYTGSGIGLAICQRVAENHGGYLTARSKPGAGATFSVYLPIL
jgi:signal transduction histidine kinase